MALEEVVNPLLNLSGKRWQIFQVLGPILGVVLVIGSITLVTLHSYKATRAGAIMLSNSLLKSEQRYITQEVGNYLSPAASSSVVADDMLNRDDYKQNYENFMLFGRSILRNAQQVSSFYMADEDGHFAMMARHNGQYEETDFRVEDGKPVYRHNVVDDEGRFLSTDALDAGDFDPRTQKWYEGAVRHAERAKNGQNIQKRLYWTDPYPYLSTRQFIVTASVAFKTLGGKRMVFATNISLNQLTQFVNSLKVGKSGQALIATLNGQVIAGHNMMKLGTKDFDASNVRIDPVNQPVFTRALNIFRIRGDGAGLINAHGKNYVTIASAMPLAKRSWVLLLNAPEEDFASFAQVIQQQTISFSLIVVGLASILAVALIYQGRRVLRYQKSLERVEESSQRESVAILKIVNTPNLLDPHSDVPVITEALARRSSAKRASIWRILSDGERVICEDMFDHTRDVHGSGIELTKLAHAAFFKVLEEGQVVDILDATQDPHFQGIQRVVMRSVDSRHLYMAPVSYQHVLVGAIMLEDPVNGEGMERIIALSSSIVALRFFRLHAEDKKADESLARQGEEHEGQGEQLPQHASSVTRPLPAVQTHLDKDGGFFLYNEEGQQKNGDNPPSGLYAHVPLMVWEFSETYTEDARSGKQIMLLVEQLTNKIQQIAWDAGLFSMQIAGNRVVFLGSCDQDPDRDSVFRLADAAITMREASLMTIAGVSTRLMFRIGIDVGSVMAVHLGVHPRIFNVWGEALSVATLLARSAPDGGQIQVSQKIYQESRTHFLFRPRGDFYFPESGVMKSYILAGRR